MKQIQKGILIMICIFATAFMLTDTVFAQMMEMETREDSLKAAGELFRSGDEDKGLEIYLSILDKNPNNLEALWNTAVIYARKGYRQDDEQSQKNFYEKALDQAERAVDEYPESGYAHYAMAVAKGRMTKVLGRGESISMSNEIKNHLEKASAKLPDFAPVWHLYGVWHSDVANVSGLGRAAAGIFSEGLPDASNEKAEKYLLRAVDLNSDTILFRLDLAKHYLETGQNSKAEIVLKKVIDMKPVMKEDSKLLEEAESLLAET